jgi:hypothetical protein
MMICKNSIFFLAAFASAYSANADVSISPLPETRKNEVLDAVLNSQDYRAAYYSIKQDEHAAARELSDALTNAGSFRESLPAKPDQTIPSQEQLSKILRQGQSILRDRYGQVEPSPSWLEDDLADPGCVLIARTASGIEKTAGGLNGVTSLYDCAGASLLTYEFDYRDETRQTVTIFDNEYAADPQTHAYRVQKSASRWANGEVRYLSWINPKYEIRAEFYCRNTASCPSDAVEDTIRKTAQQLVPDPSSIILNK